MVFSTKSRNQNRPSFEIDNYSIDVVSSFKYLGYIVTDNLKDNNDFERVRSKFYAEFNSVYRRFYFAGKNVLLVLFNQFCLQFYGNELWIRKPSLSGPLEQFAVGYHIAIKKIMNFSYHESNHYACQESQLLTFQHLLNKYTIMSAIKLMVNPCNFISKIKDFFRVSSVVLNQAYEILRNVYDIESMLENDRDAILSRIHFIQNNERQMREAW